MRERLGFVTNCLARRLEKGEPFEDLVLGFGRAGFAHVEIRDGGYLRASDFGEDLSALEALAERTGAADWKMICRRLHEPGGRAPAEPSAPDRSALERLRRFLTAARSLRLSYAIAHPWTRAPADLAADTAAIARAKMIAYLLGPEAARLRLVDLEAAAEPEPAVAAGNLRRYGALLPGLPVVLAVENARAPALTVLALAVRGGARLAYDAANDFDAAGAPLGSIEGFWSALRREQLASVHLKQRTAQGVTARLAGGYVDFQALVSRLAALGYAGDLLLEYAASDEPLEDALASRRYLAAGGAPW
jgi:sugar phosphate isomerase/epimerase